MYGVGGTRWDSLGGGGAKSARDRWVWDAGSRCALFEELRRSTGEGESVMHVVAVGRSVMIDTDRVHTVASTRWG